MFFIVIITGSGTGSKIADFGVTMRVRFLFENCVFFLETICEKTDLDV